MSELKFRFVDKGDGTVYKPITLKELCLRIELPRRIILESENGDFVDTDDFLDQLENGELIAEQYTSLKDKNGKEIYEGDIVNVEDDEYTPDTNKFLGYNATVKASISKGGAFTVKNWWGEQILNWDVPLRRVEVIGNIHENLELLEGEK